MYNNSAFHLGIFGFGSDSSHAYEHVIDIHLKCNIVTERSKSTKRHYVIKNHATNVYSK